MCCVGQVRPMQPVPKLQVLKLAQRVRPLVQQIAHLLYVFVRLHLFQ
jgi:hypothetical protein